MTSGFHADADRIAARAKDFDEHAGRAKAVVNELGSAVGGAPWGSDAVGASFDAAHRAAAGRAFELISSLGGELSSFGEKLDAAAKTYRAADTGTADDVSALDREL